MPMKIKNLLTTMALTIMFLIAGKVGWGQTVIGSYPQMDGGFEGQTANPSTTLYGTTWTHNASSAVLNMSDGRSGPKYITLTQSGTSHKRLISPDVTGILASTSYVVQFYYQGDLDGTVGTNTIRSGITQDHSLSATFVYSSYLSPNTGLTWTKFYTVLTCNSTAPNIGNGIISINNTSRFNIDDFVVYAGSAVDETAPNSPGAITINNETTSSLDVSWVAADDVDGGGYVVVRFASDPGTENDPNQNGIYAIGNTVPTGGTVVYIGTSTSFTDNSLSQGTQYWYKVYTVDKAFNYSNESTGNASTLIDITAPVWTTDYPKTVNVYNTQFDLVANLDEAGTVYYVVVSDGSGIPDVAAVKGHTAAGQVQFGNFIYTTGDVSHTVSGLSAGTTYDVYVVAEDNVPNLQTSVTAIADVTTTSIMPEPTNHATGFAASNVISTTAQLDWIDAVAGAQAPENYVIVINTTGTFSVTDGTPIADDTDFSDGTGAINVAYGVQTYTLSTLIAGQTYTARIYPYTNSGTSIDFKTDGTIPEITFSTHLITVTSPNLSTDRYIAGDNVTITWTSANMDGETIKFEAYVRQGLTSTWGWITEETALPNTGSFEYQIPEDTKYGTQYKIRLTGNASGATDESDNGFRIIAKTSIYDVQSQNTAGASNWATDSVRIGGRVTAIITGGKKLYLQAGTGAWSGIYVSYLAEHGCQVGDSLIVIGKAVESSSITQIYSTVPLTTIASNSNTLPEAKVISTLDANAEEYESVLIKVTGATCTAIPATGKYTLNDGSGDLVVYKSLYDPSPALEINRKYDIKGVLGYYNPSYQLYPRDASDIYLYSNVATLSDLKVDGATITGFDAATLTYNVELPYGTTTVPTVTYTETDTKSADILTNAASLPGNTTVALTSEDGLVNNTYTINFTVTAASTDATLSALAINGTSLTVADCEVTAPTEAGATMWFDSFASAAGIVPTKNDATATVEVKVNDVVVADPASKALADNDVILVTVTAQNGTTVKYYKVTLQQKPIITATFNNINFGTITPSGSVIVEYNANQAFVINAAAGYHIATVAVDAGPIDIGTNPTSFTYTFNNVTDNHTIDVTFAFTTYTVTFNVTDGTNPIEGATVSFNTTNVNTDASGVATFTDVAPATLAYSVVKTGYYPINSNVTVDGDKTVNVTMTETTVPTYTVTFTVKEEGVTPIEGATVTMNSINQVTNASGVATFNNVTAATGIAYTVTKTEYVDATGTVDVVDANVDEAVSMTKKTFTIAASAGANGTITPSGDATVVYGEGQSYDITASTGYHIASLLVDGNAVTAAANEAAYTYGFTNVTANHTIAVTFAINTYTITVTAGANGTTTPNTNQTVNYDGNVSFTVAADANYHIKDVLVDGASVGAVASYDFTNVTANHTFESQFEIDSHTITANVTPAGAGTVTGDGAYNHGATVTLTATANSGYKFKEWQVNSVQVGTNATYSFTATADVTVDAVFEAIVSYTITANITPAGAGTVSGDGVFEEGATVTLTATANSGYNFKEWQVNSVQVGTNATYSFTATADVTVDAVFEEVTSDLFFSEYLEGGSNNKAIEIYNPKTSDVDLSHYKVKLYPNGAATASSELALTGTLVEGGVYVIANAGSNATILGIANTTSTVTYFNGNDALGLYKDDVLIDVIGTIGSDPGTSNWAVAGTDGATANHTLVRKNDVISGTTDWAASAGTTADDSQWIVNAQDDVSFLGWHISKSSAKDILAFTLADQEDNAVIDATAHTVNITVINGTAVTALTPTIKVSNFATISPASGVATDFTNPVTYTVTAQDGTTLAWTVTVTVSSTPSSKKDITSFAIANQLGTSVIDATAGTVTVLMPYGTTLTSLAPTITVSAGATINPASGTPQDFSSAVTYTVTAQNTETKAWTVTVTNQVPVSLSIHDIQYTTATPAESPYKGQLVRTKGIVTAVKAGTSTTSFYLQDGDSEWGGIYVYSSSYSATVGDSVEIVATVAESYSVTQLNNAAALTILNQGNTLPTPVAVSTLAANNEKYESMLVKVTNATCNSLTTTTSGGSTVTTGGVINDGTGDLTAYYGLYSELALTVGTIYDITGVISYYGSIFEILPRDANDVITHVPTYTVTFNVTHNSTAMEGVTITVNSQTLTTNASGVATIDLVNGDYSFTATKSGYNDYSGSFTVAGAAKTVDVVMYATDVETNTIASLKAFPNPFSNEIKFSGADITRVTITSIIGQVVMDKTVSGENSINTQELVRGIYLVKFTNNKGESTLRKLVKE
ncbi:hypothetical protein CYCD_17630 [Tenuifilaceae bacterium CYCD]|nr:hypothetical protein CYCD_17630 [Tenuifilaceae bacterium CYCD]